MDARSFAGNPYDGHILNAQLEQSRTLLDDVGMMPREAVVDLGFRGGDWDNPGVEIIHRGKIKQLSAQQKKWLRRRQAVEPVIGHLKEDLRTVTSAAVTVNVCGKPCVSTAMWRLMTPESSRAAGRYRNAEWAMPLAWQARRWPCRDRP